jgi:hypothetical protein
MTGGTVLAMDETTFSLIHPLTAEKVTLSREWIVSLDERAAIMEHDSGLPREGPTNRPRLSFSSCSGRGDNAASS